MPIIYPSTSRLSLSGNNLTAIRYQSSWGFPENSDPTALDPERSKLHKTYSVDDIPNVRIADFNRAALGGSTTTGLNFPSKIDELDLRAPNFQVYRGGIISQIYKSPVGRQYKQLGPREGRY